MNLLACSMHSFAYMADLLLIYCTVDLYCKAPPELQSLVTMLQCYNYQVPTPVIVTCHNILVLLLQLQTAFTTGTKGRMNFFWANLKTSEVARNVIQDPEILRWLLTGLK